MPANTANVTVECDANTEPDFDYYEVCLAKKGSYNYSSPALQGTETEHQFIGMNDNTKHCFVVRAVDGEGFDSTISREVCVVKYDQPDTDGRDTEWAISDDDFTSFSVL